MNEYTLWKTKLAAWLHDPAEKALILMRDKTGHEWGTLAQLRETLFGSRAMRADVAPVLKRADWYAAAADRPQWPKEKNQSYYAAWTQVDFATKPVLKHPLTGQEYPLEPLDQITPEHIKAVSLDHFQEFKMLGPDGKPDFRKTLLAYWRFGPETPAGQLHHVWQNLPADTRVPDHSIWTHLDLVSAFAGAMAEDATATPALLAVSFGPVQGFISEARTTSDLWAGSHLLASIAWEGMKVICEQLGPDAVLFPKLRTVPLVDVWLRDQIGLPTALFKETSWAKDKTDANPLFGAALPNRFVAIVPADQAQRLAEEITERVRGFMVGLGDRTLRKILKEIGEIDREDAELPAGLPARDQLAQQLRDFPEVHWAAVPWSLAEGPEAGGKRLADDRKLRQALAGFYPTGEQAGFVDSAAWKVLSQGVDLDGAKFYDQNPGVLYPVLYDLLDRVAAAAKTARTFEPLKQQGYRSSLNGEREWLTLNRTQLDSPPGSRTNTLWTRLAKKKPSWAKPGEHLDGLAAIKRLWPTLFTENVENILDKQVRRYVVSTHTLALAVSLERWLDQAPRPELPVKLRNLLESDWGVPTALPRRIASRLYEDNQDAQLLCRQLPGLLDALKEQLNSDDVGQDQQVQANNMLSQAEQDLKGLFGAKPEAYYGLLMLDGDRMGAWLSGSREIPQIRFQDAWHPQIKAATEARFQDNQALRQYLDQPRPPSPARHGSISEALNHFSLKTARFVVEDCFKGKLIYAGGDDVLAFVCVDDLLPAMTLLRCLYSGQLVPEWLAKRLDDKTWRRIKKSNNGWLLLDDDLLLTMGEKATASCGAVVAHHQTPLGMVLRALREAEKAAKSRGGRDAFSLRILKRAGGEVGLTAKWFAAAGEDAGAAGLLDRLMRMLAHPDVSRRAAYHSVEWLTQLPEPPDPAMLQANLAYQFARQAKGEDLKAQMRSLAKDLAGYVSAHQAKTAAKALADFLMTAEFLARNSRTEDSA